MIPGAIDVVIIIERIAVMPGIYSCFQPRTKNSVNPLYDSEKKSVYGFLKAKKKKLDKKGIK